MSKINRANRGAVFSRLFGNNIARAREIVAAGLIRTGVGPNTLTFLGLLCTVAAAVFMGLGAGDKIGEQNWYAFWAGIGLIFASACDMLDGAVARNSQQMTLLGAFLDSCFDRIADGAIFVGIAIYYLNHPEIPRAKIFVVATMVALVNAQITSYVKARAENVIDKCPVGYWQRGERIAGILIGLFCGHIGTVMVMLAVLGGLTVLRRLIFAGRQLIRRANNLGGLDPKAPLQGIMRLALWRYPRGSIPYDIVTACNIALILFVDF